MSICNKRKKIWCDRDVKKKKNKKLNQIFSYPSLPTKNETFHVFSWIDVKSRVCLTMSAFLRIEWCSSWSSQPLACSLFKRLRVDLFKFKKNRTTPGARACKPIFNYHSFLFGLYSDEKIHWKRGKFVFIFFNTRTKCRERVTSVNGLV